MVRVERKIVRTTGTLFMAMTLLSGCATVLDQGREAEAQGKLSEAEALYRRSIQEEIGTRALAENELVELLIEKAKGRVSKGKLDEGQALYEDALAIDSEANQARLGIARILLKRGQNDEAVRFLEADAGCRGCGRLLGSLLQERGRQQLEAGFFEKARADFQRALELFPDLEPALAIVESYIRAKQPEAAHPAMENALSLIQPGDSKAIERFLHMRTQLVVESAIRGNEALVDRYLTLQPPGESATEWFALQIRLSEELYRRGKADDAIQRLEGALASGGEQMDPGKRGEIEKALGAMYTLRGTQRLQGGLAQEADQDFLAALRIEPGNNAVILQRALARLAMNEWEEAKRIVESVPSGRSGQKELRALLWSHRSETLLKTGKVKLAETALERAREAKDDMPEVRLAYARILVRSPIEGLDKKELSELRSSGLVHYAGGMIPRYAEALAELEGASNRLAEYSSRYLWRMPKVADEITLLEGEIKEHYSLPVSFHEEDETVLRFHSIGPLRLELEGPGGLGGDRRHASRVRARDQGRGEWSRARASGGAGILVGGGALYESGDSALRG